MLTQIGISQDIAVKKDNTRFNTHVVKITTDSVRFKGYNANKDSVFASSKSNLKMIIFEIGTIENFETKTPSTKPIPKEVDYASGRNKQPEPIIRNTVKYATCLDIGGGVTGAILGGGFANHPNLIPAQINLCSVFAGGEKRIAYFGFNLNYSFATIFSSGPRLSAMAATQIILAKNENGLIYFSLMAGLAYYPPVYGRYFNIDYLPVAHLGLGGKYYFTGSNAGMFFEGGIGGPNMLCAGVFFY